VVDVSQRKTTYNGSGLGHNPESNANHYYRNIALVGGEPQISEGGPQSLPIKRVASNKNAGNQGTVAGRIPQLKAEDKQNILRRPRQ
jgi:hypothetical protein